mmetsp:Transcript_26382/g.80082  ORF Transcript_26382/g.80082 Transcript_26382/m.80082 type:complete len:570 (+) Transcript_26382:2-1711(+)
MAMQLSQTLESQRAIVPIMFALWRRRGDRLRVRDMIDAKAALSSVSERAARAEKQAADYREKAVNAEKSEKLTMEARAALAKTTKSLHAAEEILADERRKVLALNAEISRRKTAEKQAEARASAWEAEAARYKSEKEWRMVVEDMIKRDASLSREVGDVAVQLEAFEARMNSIAARAREELSENGGLLALFERHMRSVHEWMLKRKGLLEAREANFLHCFIALGMMNGATEEVPAAQPAQQGFHNRGSTTLNRSLGVKPPRKSSSQIAQHSESTATAGALPNMTVNKGPRKKPSCSDAEEDEKGVADMEPVSGGIIASCRAAVESLRSLKDLPEGVASAPPARSLAVRQSLPVLGAKSPRVDKRREECEKRTDAGRAVETRSHNPWPPPRAAQTVHGGLGIAHLSPSPVMATAAATGPITAPSTYSERGPANAATSSTGAINCGLGGGSSTASSKAIGWKTSTPAPSQLHDTTAKLPRLYGSLCATSNTSSNATLGRSTSPTPVSARAPTSSTETYGLLPRPPQNSPRARATKRTPGLEGPTGLPRMTAWQDDDEESSHTFFPTATAAC